MVRDVIGMGMPGSSDERSSPSVYIHEASDVPRIAPATSGVVAFAGWTMRGPTTVAVEVTSWASFEQRFGGFHPEGGLARSVWLYFANGGQRAWIVRLGEGSNVPLTPGEDAFTEALFPASVPPASHPRGLQVLDSVSGAFDLLCVPGVVDTPTLEQLATFCRDRQCFLIADATNTTGVSGLSPITGEGARNAALYFPWIEFEEPDGTVRTWPSSGAVAGVYARFDASTGPWKSPSGTNATLAGIRGLSRAGDDASTGALADRGINTLRAFPDRAPMVWGARSHAGGLGAHPEWRYVGVRRTLLFIERSLQEGLRWAVFEPNDESLWTRVRQATGAFLHELFSRGAFAGQTEDEAWFVRCDRSTMSEQDIASGRLIVLVGVALLKPAEFTIIRIQQVVGTSNREPND